MIWKLIRNRLEAITGKPVVKAYLLIYPQDGTIKGVYVDNEGNRTEGNRVEFPRRDLLQVLRWKVGKAVDTVDVFSIDIDYGQGTAVVSTFGTKKGEKIRLDEHHKT